MAAADETDEEIRPESFVSTSGFLRAGAERRHLPRVDPGPPFTADEADEWAHDFLAMLAADRELQHDDDPVEMARANGLMVLFGEEEQEAFESLLTRFPEERRDAWRELISGGASSEAFGPLTLQEQLDEKQVDEALQAGRKQRVVNLVLALVGLVVVLGGAVTAWVLLTDEDQRDQGALQFDDLEEDPVVASVEGGPPVAEPLLTVSVADEFVIAAGEGDAVDRVVSDPVDTHRWAPGALGASLFQYAATGQVLIAGPAGFTDDACLRVSVVTADLRPIDTVTHGDCVEPVGRPATVGCLGADAILLAVRIPPGEVELPEGGSGFADAVRIQSITDGVAGFEVVSVRGTIAVPVDTDVVIPRFGGEIGAEVAFDLGDAGSGTCVLTGEFAQ